MSVKFDGSILIVDDDRDVLFTARLVLNEKFERVQCLSNPADLPVQLGQRHFDVVVLDMNFTRGADSGAEGLYWLQEVMSRAPDTQVIMTTAFGEIDLAVQAIKNGAVDFLMKPWENEKLVTTVAACFRLSQTVRRVQHLEDTQQVLQESLEKSFPRIIGKSIEIRRVFELIDTVADTDASVLILGENGTGKELVAHAIHRQSGRAAQAMINVDIGAIAESLFESEMFGHKKGAFTGADTNRAGRFELASGSTLFLDEIGNLGPSSQAKLLGVLERREITRIGSDKAIPIDIRLLSATNVPLAELTADSRFRRDLLYRINTVEITLPALRDRKEDIPSLVNHFVTALTAKYSKATLGVSRKTLKAMQNYHWPGNVRELKHSIERAVIVAKGKELEISDLFLQHPAGDRSDVDYNLESIEKNTIEKALSHFDGNVTLAAKKLGVGRTTLYRKLEKYGLSNL
jgi:DNA-binding NtrC family response regulator